MNKERIRNANVSLENFSSGADRHAEKKSIYKDYRFTAVLPEPVGQRLRIHCAQHRLKLKNVFAKAIIEFLDKQQTQPTSPRE
jgi:hypothetical protein